jgi:hypothetical protein
VGPTSDTPPSGRAPCPLGRGIVEGRTAGADEDVAPAWAGRVGPDRGRGTIHTTASTATTITAATATPASRRRAGFPSRGRGDCGGIALVTTLLRHPPRPGSSPAKNSHHYLIIAVLSWGTRQRC